METSTSTQSTRQLRLVLSTEDKEYYLEHPIPAAPVAQPGQQIPPEDLAAHAAWVKGQKEVAVLMLLTMDLDIQRNLAHLGAYDMLQELKAMFSKQAEQELLQTVREFHTCKQEEGQSVSTHVLKMKGYIDNLERLGQPVGQNLAGGLHEESLPKKDANPALHAIRAGRVQKNQKNKPHKAGRGGKRLKAKNKNEAMLNIMLRFAPNLRLLHHLRRITQQRTPFATNGGRSLGTGKERPVLSHRVMKKKKVINLLGSLALSVLYGDIAMSSCRASSECAIFFESKLLDLKASGSVEDLELIQEEDTNPSVETSLNHEEDDQEIDEPQRDLGEPANYKAALLDPESKKWLDAMNVEMQSMKDNDKHFSPVADIRAIRILIAIAAYYDYEIWQMDVKTAFLNGHLSEEVYMEQPEGFVNPKYPNHVCKLKRSIYGLNKHLAME
ncbi:zinc finger, CCHC-type containing protein [Tanacetum coccineum]